MFKWTGILRNPAEMLNLPNVYLYGDVFSIRKSLLFLTSKKFYVFIIEQQER